MRLDRAFFDLQVRFAEGVARIAGMPPGKVMLTRLAETRDACAIRQCFALSAIAVQAPASVFHEHGFATDRPR
ncbi:hypothetical protein ACFSHT_37750 [Paraburkholderia silviterrae]|uniref:Uncharacterized protein n=1 Tax=Paraburkholderia silviterrae TaxID=2528715 RepID=A0A4R5M3X8_9BURK|nr:hypothetical protein [Paraburkholderia silviterrae]TDG20441.1 hypothetical protein EYW47_26740 [Paraburkholderia silviterrae]